MEEKLLADEAVNTANADYREIFNSVNDAICIDDIATGVFVDVNKKMLDIYGYTPEEIITMNVGDLSPDEPGYRQEDTVDWRQKAIDGEPQTFEWKAKDKQGRVFWVEVSLKRAMLGGMDRLIAVVRNIDARKRAEDERKANEEKMQRVQKLESLGIMAGGIAHDFNNLLMVILGNIDMGMMSIPKDSQAAVNLKTAEKACESAADLTKQMLAYAGKGQFVVQRIDFNEIIREMDKVLRITISRKVSISYVLDEALPHVEADSGQMKQLVMNLVINASEAIGDNEGSISVMTGSAFPDEIQGKETILMSENLKDGRFVFLEVSDTGGGIDEDVLPRIFDPFFTTKFVGRGLGLAAVMGIVKNAGGAIKIENRKGEGAGFTLYIPACADDGLPGKRGHERSYGSKVALIVDDENDVIEIGTQMLGLLGYKSLTARNGAEAVRILRENVRNAASGDERISIILLDIGMPVIGGEEAFEEIMRIDRTIPVFISSGYGEVEIARRFMNKNIAGFLNKPYTFENLKKVFEDYFKE
jgi:PAS domain S-box-containing protein